MERLLNCSLLEKIYEDRNEDLSHIIIKRSIQSGPRTSVWTKAITVWFGASMSWRFIMDIRT